MAGEATKFRKKLLDANSILKKFSTQIPLKVQPSLYGLLPNWFSSDKHQYFSSSISILLTTGPQDNIIEFLVKTVCFMNKKKEIPFIIGSFGEECGPNWMFEPKCVAEAQV